MHRRLARTPSDAAASKRRRISGKQPAKRRKVANKPATAKVSKALRTTTHEDEKDGEEARDGLAEQQGTADEQSSPTSDASSSTSSSSTSSSSSSSSSSSVTSTKADSPRRASQEVEDSREVAPESKPTKQMENNDSTQMQLSDSRTVSHVLLFLWGNLNCPNLLVAKIP